MILNNDQIKSITFGALHIEEADGKMRFFRFTPEMLEAWSEFDNVFTSRTRATAGIRLDFHTNSKHMALNIEAPAKFEVYINGLLRYTMEEVDTLSVDIDTPRGQPLDDAHVTIYFPSHKHGCFSSLELDDGAYVKPHSFDRKILFLGDSITQGWDTVFDSLSFANKVSRYFNAESLIQGVGGACFFPQFLEPISFEPDWVVVAYGTNDFDRYRDDEPMIEKHMNEYLEKLSGMYGDKKIFVVSPIWRRLSKPEARERFERLRKTVEVQVKTFGFTLIDGSLLVPPINALYTDGLHPNDAGFSLYAENLIAQLEAFAQ